MSRTAPDAVYGQTHPHPTMAGAKAEAAWHDVKAAVPGTAEHQMKQAAKGQPSGTTGTGTHVVQDATTGEVRGGC